MKNLVFCLEEPSAGEMLKGVLPRMLPDEIKFKFIVFQGKQDLEKQLIRRLRGWRVPNTYFIVLRDQDAADCHNVKKKLIRLCKEAGKPDTLIRIACRELESFYLGDIAAIEKGLGLSNIARKQNSTKFRNPDRLSNPVHELYMLTGYKYQKISGQFCPVS